MTDRDERVRVAFGEMAEQDRRFMGFLPDLEVVIRGGQVTVIETRYPLLQEGDGMHFDALDKAVEVADKNASNLAKAIGSAARKVAPGGINLTRLDGRGSVVVSRGVLYVEPVAWIIKVVHPAEVKAVQDVARKVADDQSYKIVDVM